jgi:hypothetical protein
MFVFKMSYIVYNEVLTNFLTEVWPFYDPTILYPKRLLINVLQYPYWLLLKKKKGVF